MAMHISQQDYYVGNSALDKDSGRYFLFPSRTDAMIASLALAHDASPGLMDAILSIIHEKSFNPSEMKLQRTEDIYLHVSKHDSPIRVNTTGVKNVAPRITERELEGTNACVPVTAKPVSPIVIGEVIRWMDEEIQNRCLPLVEGSDLKQTLTNLALVQRRWAYPVRRVLGRLVKLRFNSTKEALKEFLASPYIGPWTRDLSLHSCPVRGIDGVRFAKMMDIALNEKMTGLHKLAWNFALELISTDSFESIFSRLSSVKELVLTSLAFSQSSFSQMSAPQLRSIISMPCLKNLTFEDWIVSEIPCQGLPLGFAPFTPSPSLRALRLKNPYLDSESKLPFVSDTQFVWTRDSFDNFFLSTILLHCRADKRYRFTELELGKFTPLLPRLETLHVICPMEDCLLWIFDRCPKTLYRLSMEFRDFPSEAILRRVPRTVRELSLSLQYWDFPSSPALSEDIRALLRQMISSNSLPELRTFRMYFDHKPGETVSHEGQSILQEVKTLCEERNVDFVVGFFLRPLEYCFCRQIKDVVEDMDILHDSDLEEVHFREQIPILRALKLPKSPFQDDTSDSEDDSSEDGSDY